MQLLSKEDFHAVAGTCRECGAQVAHYLCNDGLIAARPAAAEWDWWLSCTNAACVHHQGEGLFQESPAWLLPAARDLLGDVPAGAQLGAYWVGEHDVYAAHSPEQALELCEGHSGMPDTFDMDDVRELTAVELDKPLQEEDGTPCGTVRSMLAAMTAPGELVSFE